MKIMVSACLLGDNVKYDGNNNYNQELINFLKDHEIIKVCPELLGGLPTPRKPSEILHDKVIDIDGSDVTKEFTEGALKTLEIAKENDIKVAILKRNSPSCGFNAIYDGTFTHTITNGNGITADLLSKNGIKVLNEDNYREYFKRRGIESKDKDFIIKKLCELKYNNKNLTLPLGWKKDGEPIYRDFTNISGLFITGSTGSGKSVFIDDLIVSLIYKNTSEEVKFIMFDPKKIELGEYDGIKHLLIGKAQSSLKKGYDSLIFILKVLESRINTLNKTKNSSIEMYNQRNEEKWPHIFIFIDEGSNLIKMKDAHLALSKILDYGTKVGIHLIYATNAYLKDYASSRFIDKFQYRMSFDLASEEQEKFLNIEKSSLLKQGEALIKNRNGEIFKIHAPLVTDEEINEVVVKNIEVE